VKFRNIWKMAGWLKKAVRLFICIRLIRGVKRMPKIIKCYCDNCGADISNDSSKWCNVSIHCKYNVDKSYSADIFLCTNCWFKVKKVITEK
jgi:hypothetical protein